MAGGAFVAGEAYFDAFAGQRVDVHLGPFDEYQMPTAETRPASTRLSRWYETVWTEISLCLAISDAGAGPPSSTRSMDRAVSEPSASRMVSERSLSKSTVNRWRGAWSMEGRWGEGWT